ncbi:hypothetical protein CFB47_23730 [Burkholderia sp. AU27893]|uniref:Uncharacterized protein n=1 Tax=Burkholderia contaminans TaxID=488447 RepID=A0A2S5E7A4_9BURK|nr:hypothetical protein CFB47_23730 [Burkholderia sp. AU27893]OXI96518.1 hypothetical protein CFB41_25960 [Burkholderia sp. AU33803]POZ87270.1 hypothetical protein C3743_12785 [Burkholderia contaminans]PRD94171.1 hypothetical protein C6P88_10965 [Burkholderia contaminans]
MPIVHARGRFIGVDPTARRAPIAPITFLEITTDKRVDASHSDPLPSLPSNYMECSVNTDASCSWSSTNLTAA